MSTNHELKSDQVRIKADLKKLKAKTYDSAKIFLQLSGIPLPKGGYVVVDDFYNILEEDNSVVVKTLSNGNYESLVDLQKELIQAQGSLSSSALDDLGQGINEMVRNFRSSALGIGSETIKQSLKEIDKAINEVNSQQLTPSQRLSTYQKALQTLQSIVGELNQEEDHIRLGKLRSTRSYNETLEEYHQINTRLEDNQVQLDKARQAVSNVIWYFNNQELSTRGLEKQDPEIYGQWFSKAKEEWNNFNHNRGGIF